jgi:hypothetical protein
MAVSSNEGKTGIIANPKEAGIEERQNGLGGSGEYGR